MHSLSTQLMISHSSIWNLAYVLITNKTKYKLGQWQSQTPFSCAFWVQKSLWSNKIRLDPNWLDLSWPDLTSTYLNQPVPSWLDLSQPDMSWLDRFWRDLPWLELFQLDLSRLNLSLIDLSWMYLSRLDWLDLSLTWPVPDLTYPDFTSPDLPDYHSDIP